MVISFTYLLPTAFGKDVGWVPETVWTGLDIVMQIKITFPHLQHAV
jgi:hypothetical protein